MNPLFNNRWSPLKALSASLVLVVCAGMSGAQADDTEVFFPENVSNASDLVQQPNILFMLDTSGSMACSSLVSIDTGSGNICEFDTDPISRIDRLKSALIQVLDDLPPTVNVGLGRFSGTEGAAILFPVSGIDAQLRTVVGNKVLVDAYTSGLDGSESEENLTSNVVQHSSAQNPDVVRVGTYDPSTATPTTTPGSLSVAITSLTDEAEQWGNGIVETGPDSGTGRRCGLANSTATRGILNLVANPTTYTTASNACAANNTGTGATPGKQLIGLRFQNVNLPKNATVTSAKLTFTVFAAAPSTVRKVDFRVRGEAADNSAAFTISANNISGRATTGDIAGSISSSTNPSSGTLTLSPELKDIVTAIKDRAGWNTNNAMTFILVDDGSNNSAQRRFHSFFSGGAASAPRLSINFETTTTPPPTANKMLTGLRFENVQVPRGATIRAAYLELRARGNQSSNLSPQINLNVTAQAIGDSPALQTANANLSSRTKTDASVSMSIPTSLSNEDSVLSPDMKAVIQQVTDGASWCGGNALTVFLDGSPNAGLTNGNRFNAYSNSELVVIDGTSEEVVKDGPILHIELDATDTRLSGASAGCANGRSTSAVSINTDDGEQRISNGSVNLADSDLELGFDGTNEQLIGMRFTGVRVPQGAIIQSAFIDFTATTASTGVAGFKVSAHNTGNANPLTAGTNALTALAPKTAEILWNSADGTLTDWVDQTVYSTPNLSSIVQTVVNGAWAEGNSMTFFVKADCPSGNVNCRRRAFTKEGSTSGAPRLRIQFQGSAIALTVRDELKRLVLDLPASGGTPSVEALWEAARYFRGEDAFYGRTRGNGAGPSTTNALRQHRLSHVKTFTAASGQTVPVRPATTPPNTCADFNPGAEDCRTEHWENTTVYKTPITNSCSSNNLIFFTDGTPNSNDGGEAKVKALAGIGTCAATPVGQGGNCAKELTRFLHTSDQSTASVGANLTGAQVINTYGVLLGFASGSTQDQWLDSVAAEGGGSNFLGNDAQQLVGAFNNIINNILDVNTSFVAPAVTVNTFNRLTNRNELYFALFQPKPQVKWEGNLKRYTLATSPTARIVDATGADAVDAATGFFKTTARSLWTPVAITDGKDVNRGGLASMLTNTRNMYTYSGANKTPSAVPSPFNLSTELLHEDNTAITGALLAIPVTGDTTADAAERVELLKWARGLDVDDDNGNDIFTDARQSLGDPLHSEPLLITYKGVDPDNDGVANQEVAPDITLYYADNEGVFHAVDPDDGTEIFSYVPKELYGNFYKIRGNTVGFRQRPYGLDGPITRFHNDLNGDLVPLNLNGTVQSTGGVEEKVFLYIGMRRGGRNYYSLDVTNRAAPKLRWTIYGGTGQYAELGQSWSRAIATKIKLNGVVKDVIIFSGGYDPDQDGRATVQNDGQGRAVYIADAITGERLWWASVAGSDLNLSTMTFSIPASPKVIDMNGDSIADRIYLADAGGQIFRINLNAVNTGAATLANGSRIAVLSDANSASASRTTANARRFFASPDIALVKDKVAEPFLAVSIGSGFREKPNGQSIQDRFYVLRDPDDQLEENNPLSIIESDLFDSTSNVIGQGSASAQVTARADLESKKGFYINLVNSSNAFVGEKVIADSLTFQNKVIFSSFQPGVAQSACSSVLGLSRLYLINIVDGTPAADLSAYTPTVDPPSCATTSCDAVDRALTLRQQGLPPDPTILFPEQSSPLVCEAAECFRLGLQVDTNKTYWLKKSD